MSCARYEGRKGFEKDFHERGKDNVRLRRLLLDVTPRHRLVLMFDSKTLGVIHLFARLYQD